MVGSVGECAEVSGGVSWRVSRGEWWGQLESEWRDLAGE